MKIICRCLFLFLLLVVVFVPDMEQAAVDDGKTREITVEVKGAVESPGVYSLEAFSTVADLLEMLQLDDDADLSSLNMTTILKNHDVIVIPLTREEGQLVSINSAPEEELITLPGIGPVMAARIIEYRTNQGFFQSIDDLTKVKGIGPKTLEKLRPLICL